ncbi:hypothetical protein M409DRAFT_21614 [Zasmidium cellare ATCC 36951]|uniref:Enoyl reductase (ER) domain-containing protein n=1 Tax=Zasmidium cellare ATCC 36951 TaxID=1080233 RepID=A0A6A6CPW0_ZASCE|nr:uncharacterized protein M409DRAFT_21614 [Zasmidium cellare ATCC 36951]KAF2168170.1 hypothetical protein M409DRAFT_21614 [Zasmidium cellare ATCC 36951]
MAEGNVPSQMKAWQFTSTQGGIEKNLKLNPAAPLPKRKPDQHLVQVIAAALNPVDYKPAEVPLVTRFFLPKPVTPGLDFVGKIVQPADGSPLKPGQIVFGAAGNGLIGGALAQYAVAGKSGVASLPPRVDPTWGATVNVAGLTAYQSIVPQVKEGSNVFINGGSGGTGVFGIQFAKAKGCYVTTTCSTPNVDLCKSLGADEVIDYRTSDVLTALKSSGRKYDHVVDNVGHDLKLYWKAHEFTTPSAVYVLVGATISFGFFGELLSAWMRPGILGGGKRKLSQIFAAPSEEQLGQIGKWFESGQVKPVFDAKFKFEDAPTAFERMKTGRAKGKIVVEVDLDAAKKP